MVNKKTKKTPPKQQKTAARKSKITKETDGNYVLKLVLYVIIGSQWLWVTSGNTQIPLPIGLLVGLYFASHEHFQVDRKIEYAVLIVAMIIGFWAQVGIFVG